MKHRYHANPQPKKAFEKNRYKANAETLRATQQKRYKLHSTSILFNRRRVYYAFASHRHASKLIRDAVHSANKKARVQHARYLLKEPKCDVQELYVKNIKKFTASQQNNILWLKILWLKILWLKIIWIKIVWMKEVCVI